MTDPNVGAPGGAVDRYRRASIRFGELVHLIRDDQWDLPTPCVDWTVRDLVNHVAGENLWTEPLMAGRTIAEVGTAYDGDVLGDDPVASSDDAAAAARDAVGADGALERTVHLSFGDTPAAEYVQQLLADHLLHGWDLAQAIGVDDRLDLDLVDAVAAWFDTVEEAYRQAGAIGPRAAVAPDADPQARLLGRFGRSVALAAAGRFNTAFERRDVEAIMAQMTDDCVFDTTAPAPDGRRYEGRDEVASAWRELFAASPHTRFDVEEVIGADDRVVVRWTYSWGEGHVRGIDVLRVRDGLVAEKLSFVKG
ncbi:MAG TPA: TIGR03086 family metal-binding protein [Euzebyales bacterium]|nr:TIGR03086 family metal-binding protein [Euzebyales bacterium]